jgi:hypothetical protein
VVEQAVVAMQDSVSGFQLANFHLFIIALYTYLPVLCPFTLLRLPSFRRNIFAIRGADAQVGVGLRSRVKAVQIREHHFRQQSTSTTSIEMSNDFEHITTKVDSSQSAGRQSLKRGTLLESQRS